MKELVRDRIYEVIKEQPGISDRELSVRLNKIHQHINQECRVLEMEKKIRREKNPNTGVTGNYPLESAKKRSVFSLFK